MQFLIKFKVLQMSSAIFLSEPPALTLPGAGGFGGNMAFPLVGPPSKEKRHLIGY